MTASPEESSLATARRLKTTAHLTVESGTRRVVEPLLTPRDLAALFSMNHEMVRRHCHAGKGGWPHMRIGNRYRFTNEQVEAIIAMSTVTPDTNVTPEESWGRRTRRGRR